MRSVLLVLVLIVSVTCVVHAQWEQLPGPPGQLGYLTQSKSGDLFNATCDGVYRSTDNGESWAKAGLQGKSLNFVEAVDADILIALDYSSVYRTTNNGRTWDSIFADQKISVRAIMKDQDTLIMGVCSLDTSDVLYRSTDKGLHWNAIPDLAPMNGWVDAFVLVDRRVLSVTDDGSIWKFDLSEGVWRHITTLGNSGGGLYAFGDTVFFSSYGSLFRSVDGGDTWKWISSISGIAKVSVSSMGRIDSLLYASTDSGLVVSTDGGFFWNAPVDSTLTKFNGSPAPNKWIPSWNIQTLGHRLFAERGVWYATVDGVNWKAVKVLGLSTSSVSRVLAAGSTVFAETDYGIYHSTDNGQTWFEPDLGNVRVDLYDFSDRVYAFNEQLYVWNGVNWNLLHDSTSNALWAFGDTIIVNTTLYGVSLARSSDAGKNWQPLQLSRYCDGGARVAGFVEANYEGKRVLIIQAIGFNDSVTQGYGKQVFEIPVSALFISSDGGSTWSDPIYRDVGGSSGIQTSGPYRFVDCQYQEAWQADSLPWWKRRPNDPIHYFTPYFDGIIVGFKNGLGYDDIVFLPHSGDTQVILRNNLISSVDGFVVATNYAYVNTYSSGIWRAPVASLPLAVERHPVTTNADLAIYPNPSTGKATLSFSLAQRGHVTVQLYDACGILRQVAFDGEREVGENEISIDTRGLPNGIYEAVVIAGALRMAKRIAVER